jgi:hypothetical protein
MHLGENRYMKRRTPLTLLLAVLALLTTMLSCSQRQPNPVTLENFAAIGQACASNVSIPCEFDGEVLSLQEVSLPGANADDLDGYLIHNAPKWKLVLKVHPHRRKQPFQPGVRSCYISDSQAVFGVPPKDVSGIYRFTFICNVDVPGKPAFEKFKAVRE